MALNFEEYNAPIYKDDSNDKDSSESPKQQAPRRRSPNTEKKPHLPFLKDKRFRRVTGAIFILFAIYLLISGVSYFSTGAADQSAVDANSILANAKSQNIQNQGGPLGASLSELLFNKGFGWGAFCLIYMLGALGLKLIWKYKYRASSTILISLVATVTVSSILGFTDMLFGNDSFFATGGAHGKYLNAFIFNVSGLFGCIAANIILIIILIALTINTLQRIYRRYMQFLANRKLNNLERRHAEERLRRNTFDESGRQNTMPERTEPAQPTPEKIPNNHATAIVDKPAETAIVEPVATTVRPANEKTNDIPITIKTGKIEKAENISEKPFDPTAELSRYKFPPTSLLRDIPEQKKITVDIREQEENKERITKTLSDYSIDIRSIEVCVGPTVTLYEIIPAEGVRISKIKNLEDDIALSLAALGIRIIAPIPGKGTIGIEVPNKEKRIVPMRAVIESKKFQECKYDLPIALGSTISNDIFIADLAKMPHLLVAGATGQGKSVGLNAIITSLLYKKHPSELKFVMVDPKMVEFGMYSKLEYHYIAKTADEDEPIITNMHKTVATLKSLVAEMENRLVLLRDANVRNIKEYNDKFIARRLNPEKGHKFMPYIVVIIDEFADLIMNIGKEVETPIARITQKARAVGIHMILATQRPDVKVITGVIKANCPARIAFRVSGATDSRIILDRPGAQQLIGRGDMLISYNNEITRVQCAFVDTPEVEDITDFIEQQPGFDHAYELPEYTPDMEEGTTTASLGSIAERDALFEDAAAFIVSNGQSASTSSLQRRYSIGYNRAGKIMDQLEAAGIVGPSQGGKPRQVLIDSIQLTSMLENH